MPYGLICTFLGVFFGGLLGHILRRFVSDTLRDMLPRLLGLTAICNGLLSIMKVQSMPVVTLAILVGGWLGIVLRLEERVCHAFGIVLRRVPRPADFDMEQYITVAAILCTSGFGLYAVMVESFNGDHAQMFSKAMMDCFAAFIFGSGMDISVSLIALPQGAILISFFLLAKVLMPIMSEAMLLNFIACGGALTIAAGMRMAKIRAYPIIDMLPALALVLVLTPLHELLL